MTQTMSLRELLSLDLGIEVQINFGKVCREFVKVCRSIQLRVVLATVPGLAQTLTIPQSSLKTKILGRKFPLTDFDN